MTNATTTPAQHGGPRPGAGRKRKYDQATRAVLLDLPERVVELLDQLCPGDTSRADVVLAALGGAHPSIGQAWRLNPAREGER